VTRPPQTGNIWDIDCSSFFPASVSGTKIHGASLVTDGKIELIRQVLGGILKTTDSHSEFVSLCATPFLKSRD
jgi:hypothetical protein